MKIFNRYQIVEILIRNLRVLFLLSCLVPFFAFSQTKLSAAIPIISFSDISCGAWVRSAANPADREIYLFWFRGFVSGHNYENLTHQISLNSMPDNETLTLFIDKHCKDNPLTPFVYAAFSLVRQLRVEIPN